jgi:hypothetical protein
MKNLTKNEIKELTETGINSNKNAKKIEGLPLNQRKQIAVFLAEYFVKNTPKCLGMNQIAKKNGISTSMVSTAVYNIKK